MISPLLSAQWLVGSTGCSGRDVLAFTGVSYRVVGF
jgi:hypothetical protein